MCGDLGDEEIRNIVDDIRCLMQVQVEKNLGAFFKSVEEDYGLRPSIHGDPCRVFSKPLQLSRCSNRADLDDKHLLHLGVPRATVHYFEAVADVSLSTSGHPLQLSEVMCSIADASFDFFRAARRDESICNLLTNKQMKDLHRQDKKLAAEKYRKQLYDATPEGPWCTNYNVLQEHIKSYTTELTVVEEDVQRLQKELALAENKKRLLASKLVSYKNISATADLKQHLLSIVADLRIHILEQKQKRSASRVKLLSKYQEFNGVIVKDILQRRFEVELPDLYSKIMTLLLDSFDNQLDVATVNQSLRLGLEVLRLWRQLTITYANKSLLQRFTAHENALTNKLMQGDKAHSQGSNRTGEFDNCTAFLYFNHIYHDTPDGHMESKRRMDTVVEQIINKSKREIRSHALMEIAKCSVYDVNYSKEASDCSNDKISWNFSSDGNSLHLRNAETDNGNVNFDERLSDVKNNPPEALDAHMSNAHTR